MNKRRLIFRLLLIAVAAIVLLLTYKIIAQTNRKVQFNEGLLSEDRIKLYSIPDSSLFHFDRKGDLILIYFNSECDHCQREIKEIEKNVDKFEDEQMIFFSSQSLKEIESFRNQTTLKDHSSVFFEKINVSDLMAVFGNPAQPTIFIYRDGKLMQELKGEIEIPAILKFLNN
jgi:thiol-disulfide isomerase/thioredoxin